LFRRILLPVCALALAVQPATSSVGYQLFGFNFSPYIDGQDPGTGVFVPEEQIRARLTVIAPYTRWVRAFGATAGLEQTGRIAHELGLQAACGAWLSRSVAANEAEINGLILAAQQGHCDMAIVGSEVLLRGDLSEAQLLAYLDQVKAAVPPAVLVTTADVYDRLLSHPWRKPRLREHRDVSVPAPDPWDAIGATRRFHAFGDRHRAFGASCRSSPARRCGDRPMPSEPSRRTLPHER
jgi:exo-beta-1,3-glucanase (GH17 family)